MYSIDNSMDGCTFSSQACCLTVVWKNRDGAMPICRPLLSCYHPYLVCIHFGSHPYIFLHFSECVSFLVSVLSDVTLDLIGVSSFAVTSLQQPETSPSCFCSHRWVSAWIVDFGRWSTLASFTDSHMSIFKSHLQCTNIAVMCFQWNVCHHACKLPRLHLQKLQPSTICKTWTHRWDSFVPRRTASEKFGPWVWERGYIWDTYDCNRHGTWFWDCATKCGKDDKRYVERVPGSERGFERLTEREDVVVSRDGHSLLRYSRCFPVLTDLAVDFTG